MKALRKVATGLTIVGGLNWGLVGAFRWNLVEAVLGKGSTGARAVYVAVGVSAVITTSSLFVTDERKRS